MPTVNAYGVKVEKNPLVPVSIERREPEPLDVEVDILYCGVCHSDIHMARGEWGPPPLPCVPGHEIVGKVTRVGSQVKKFKVGDLAAVGCIVDSCRECPSCKASLEQFCIEGMTGTYCAPDKKHGGYTCGGYSTSIVVDERFVYRVSDKVDLVATAPLLCAGITTYSPLRHWKVGSGQKVGVVGLGGLGHMGVKLAAAMGADVTVFTTSPGKTKDAIKLGAKDVVVSKNKDEMDRQKGKFDFILDTVSADHPVQDYVQLLKRDGTLVLVGAPPASFEMHAFTLFGQRRTLSGSFIGGTAETQEMLDFCAEKGIVCDIEMIPMQKINEAYERVIKNDVKYRFVIDMKSIK